MNWPFLSCGVPDLQFDLFSPEFDGFDLEVDSDGGDEGVVEGVVREAEQDARLSHPRIPDQEQFEEEIVALLGHNEWITLLLLLDMVGWIRS